MPPRIQRDAEWERLCWLIERRSNQIDEQRAEQGETGWNRNR